MTALPLRQKLRSLDTREHKEVSKQLLEAILQLEEEIKLAGQDAKLTRHLCQKKTRLKQEFANHLTATPDKTVVVPYFQDGRSVKPCWHVDRNPKKRRKPEAAKWMAERGLQWDESAPSLRKEVQIALNHGETLPTGNFGLFVEWTVRIERNDMLAEALLNLTKKPS